MSAAQRLTGWRAAVAASLLGMVGPGIAQAADLPRLQVVEHDVVHLGGGDVVVGTIVEMRDDGTVLLRPLGDEDGHRAFQSTQYRRIERSQTAAQVVNRRGEILLAGGDDGLVDIIATIDFGVEEGAVGAATDLAVAAVERWARSQRLIESTLGLIDGDEQRDADRLGIAIIATKEHPRWEVGYAVLAEMLDGPAGANWFGQLAAAMRADPAHTLADVGAATNARDGLYRLATIWLERKPSSYDGNRLLAMLAAERGEGEEAYYALRKLYRQHGDPAAGVAYAEAALAAGELDDAVEVAGELAQAGVAIERTGAIVGLAEALAGDWAAARQTLQRAVDGGLGTDNLGTLARHNLGVALWQAGEVQPAIELWRGLNHDASRLALGIAERQPVALNRMAPDSPLLEAARELNACLALERREFTSARDALDARRYQRHAFLESIADLLEADASSASVAEVARITSVESLRWQLYGHIHAGRFAAAEGVLAELLSRAPRDGYAAVCRVYLAAERGDTEGAREAYAAVDSSENPPPSYVQFIASEFEYENDELWKIDFNWPAGFTLQQGWQSANYGTGISVAAGNSQLVLSGVQAAASDPVTRAWCIVPATRLRSADFDLDLSGVGSARVGLELTDGGRQNGVAVAVLEDGSLAQRSLSDGTWSESWSSLDASLSGRQVTLGWRFDSRLGTLALDLGDREVLVGRRLRLEGDHLAIGVFGTALPAEEWRLGLNEVVIQLEAREQERNQGGSRTLRRQ